MKRLLCSAIYTVLLASACGVATSDEPAVPDPEVGMRIAYAPAIGAAPAVMAPVDDFQNMLVSTGNGIDYHGGPVMGGTVDVYYIWYGNWGGSTAPQILNYWASNIGNSPVYRVNTTYGDNGTNVSGNVHYAGSTSVGYSHGNHPTNGDIWTIVNDVLSAGTLPV